MRFTPSHNSASYFFLCTSGRAQNIDWNSYAVVAEIKASTPQELAIVAALARGSGRTW